MKEALTTDIDMTVCNRHYSLALYWIILPTTDGPIFSERERMS